MDLALSNLQWFIYHKNKSKQRKQYNLIHIKYIRQE